MEITTKNASYELIKELGILVNSEIKEDFDFLRTRSRIDEDEVIADLRSELSDDEIMINLAGLDGIALSLTENCNFRCRYCGYSGIYNHARQHNDKTMDYDTAIKTVAFFFDLINGPFRRKKSNHFGLGFYGGEPLLQFPLMKRIIEEAEALTEQKELAGKFKIDYRVTTNGYFLNREMMDFFKDKNVGIDLSIDGPQKEHDKYRKTADGHDTWETVMHNLETLHTIYPEYYKAFVNFPCTIHPHHDLAAIEQFFKDTPELFDTRRVRFNPMNIADLKPHFKKEIDAGIKPGGQKPGPLVMDGVVRDAVEGKFKLRDRRGRKMFTGTCFPGGTKVFVDADGGFHICEKINPHFPIGNSENGFNLEKIRSVYRLYNEEIIRLKCWDCDYSFHCSVCMANAAEGSRFNIDCKDRMRDRYRVLQRYLGQVEKSGERRTFDTVSDYIERL
ncbi:MAG: radical SAM protein [bacterium]|nr:radical SAM protein [bacterium]